MCARVLRVGREADARALCAVGICDLCECVWSVEVNTVYGVRVPLAEMRAGGE